MAWTPPKTWVTNDPLIASDYNTHFRDNLNYLKGRQDDLVSKVGPINTVFNAAGTHYAVFDMTTQRSTTSGTFARIDSTLGITLTPVSDLVLFTVQFLVLPDASNMRLGCGVWKDSASYSLNYSGGGGSTNTFFVASLDGDTPVHYTAPVTVARNQQVSLYPSWRRMQGDSLIKTRPFMPMILIVQEVGAYE